MAAIHCDPHRNGTHVFWTGHRMRIWDAWGTNVIRYNMGPGSYQGQGATGTDAFGWVTTVVEAGSGTSEIAGVDEAGAIARITCAANENDGLSMQLGGGFAEFTGDQHIYCGMEFAGNDVDQTDIFFGVALLDTALLGGVTDGVYFESLDGAATLTGQLEKDSTETTTATLATLADDTYVFPEFYWDGSKLRFFVDGGSETVPATTNLPDDEAMLPSIEVLTGEAVANYVTIRQMRFIQIGR
jgi:hypothetical protein